MRMTALVGTIGASLGLLGLLLDSTIAAQSPQPTPFLHTPATSTVRGADLQTLALSTWQLHGLEHHNHMLLAKAAVEGKTDGIVLLATRLGTVPTVVAAVRALGGDVLTRFDDVGYLRTRLPLIR